jgi:hypothetical protein
VIIPPLDFTRRLDAAIDALRKAGRQPIALSMGQHRRDQLTAVMAKRGVDTSASYRDLPIRAAIDGQTTVAIIDDEGRAHLA